MHNFTAAGMLQAALADIYHLCCCLQGIRMGDHRTYHQIKYRLEPFRTKPVMDFFMEKLDDIIQGKYRPALLHIRCFGCTAQAIHARN